jgi:hypothetical protein
VALVGTRNATDNTSPSSLFILPLLGFGCWGLCVAGRRRSTPQVVRTKFDLMFFSVFTLTLSGKFVSNEVCVCSLWVKQRIGYRFISIDVASFFKIQKFFHFSFFSLTALTKALLHFNYLKNKNKKQRKDLLQRKTMRTKGQRVSGRVHRETKGGYSKNDCK